MRTAKWWSAVRVEGSTGRRIAAIRWGSALLVLLVGSGCTYHLCVEERAPEAEMPSWTDTVAVGVFAEEKDLHRDIAGRDRAAHTVWVLTLLFPIPLFLDYRIGTCPGEIELDDTLEGAPDPGFAANLVRGFGRVGCQGRVMDAPPGENSVQDLLERSKKSGCTYLLLVNYREYDEIVFLSAETSEETSTITVSGSLHFPSVSLFRVADGKRVYCFTRKYEYVEWTFLPWWFWWDGPRPCSVSYSNMYDDYKDWIERFSAGDEAGSASRSADSILEDLFPRRPTANR
jgi:hypothetical protein